MVHFDCSIWLDLLKSTRKYAFGCVYKGVTRKAYLGRKPHSECKWHLQMGWGLGLNKKEEVS